MTIDQAELLGARMWHRLSLKDVERLQSILPSGVTRFSAHFECLPEHLEPTVRAILRWAWFIGVPSAVDLRVETLLSASYDVDRDGWITIGGTECGDGAATQRLRVPFNLFIQAIREVCNRRVAPRPESIVFVNEHECPFQVKDVLAALVTSTSTEYLS